MTGWAVIVPVKSVASGKSRLDVPGVDRATLAHAIALDTVAAAAASPVVAQVFVVTDDPAVVIGAHDIAGLRFVPEGDPRGLDAAIALGAAEAGDGMPRAALLGDLPALHPEDLTDALRRAAAVDRAVVPDAEGDGSTLVTARAGVRWESAFGPDSRARHVALGCVELPLAPESSLRRDVDTAEQLRQADALGVGPRTARLVAPPEEPSSTA
ncbi:2-phospho-L-lactate guanylyltransferase [Microbacterium aureliae]